MRGHCHLASITGIGHFRLPGRMDGIPTLPVLHGLREPNAPSQILGGVSDPARVCTAHKCDSLGRSVTVVCPPGLSRQLFQQCLGLLEVSCIKALGEPAIDRCQQRAGCGVLALLLPQARQAHRRA